MTVLKHVAGLIVSLLLVAAILLVIWTSPSNNDRTANISIEGAVGEQVDAGDFTVTVHGVQVAKSIAEPSDGFVTPETLSTKGLFVVVDATVTMTEQQGPPRDAALVDHGVDVQYGGTRYGTTARATTWDTLVSVIGMEPGITQRGQIVFEIPDDPAVLAGASFNLALDPSSRLAGEASVDLGLDGAAAEKLRDKAPSTRARLKEVSYG